MERQVTKIAYARGAFAVSLDGAAGPYMAVDEFNQRAIDAAFTRRAPVVLELDGPTIRRVQSDVPQPGLVLKDPASPGRFNITRISTQVNGTTGATFAEIFIEQAPAPEQQVFTSDATIHGLCHTAYVSRQSLDLEIADHQIVTVIKSHID